MFKKITSVVYEFSSLNPLLFGAPAYFLVFFLQIKCKSALSIFTEDDSNVIFHNNKPFAFPQISQEPSHFCCLVFFLSSLVTSPSTLYHVTSCPDSIL